MAGDRTLKVTILGDSASAQRALHGVETASARVGPSAAVANKAISNLTATMTSRLGPAAGQAQAALDKLGMSAVASGGALKAGIIGGVAAAAAALALFGAKAIQTTVSLAAEIRNLQRASGASAEDASLLVAVFDDLGISQEAGAKAAFKLGRATADNGKMLAQYGVEVAKNADGTTNLSETLLNLADAYAATADQGKRNALVQAALGKGGQEFIPILEKGRAGVEAMFAGVKEGERMTQEQIDQAREFELAVDDLQDSIREFSLEAGQALIPFITNVVEGMTVVVEFVQKIGRAIADVWDEIPEPLQKVIGLAAKGATGVVGILHDLGAASDDADKEQRELLETMKAAAIAGAEEAAALEKVQEAMIASLGAGISLERANNSLTDAIEGVTEAEREYAEAQEDVSKVATEGAAKIAAAHKQREDAVKSLRDAEADLAEVEEENAENLRLAQKDVASSERELGDALRESQEAQEDLTEARKDAAEALEDLRLAVEGNALAEERALLRLEEARNNQGKAQGTASELSREGRKAALDVREAEQELAETREKSADDAAKLAEAEAKGIEGADVVVDARQRVIDADQRVIDTQEQLRESTRNVAKVQEESAERIVAAHDRIRSSQDTLNAATTNVTTVTQAAADAQEAAHRKVETAADGLRDAELRVKDAALGAADAHVTLRQREAEMRGETLDGTERLELYRQKLDEVGAQAAGKTLDDIRKLRDGLNEIPPVKEVKVRMTLDQFNKEDSLTQTLLLATGLFSMPEDTKTNEARKILGLPPRAHGGPVKAGRAYLVGERGPEPFIPDVNGRILPYVPGGSSSSVRGGDGVAMGSVTNISVNAQTNADPYDIAREVDWVLRTRY